MVAYGLPERDATITRHEVQNAVAEQLSEHNDTALLERLTDAVLAHRELVPLPTPKSAEAGWEQQWTTRRLLALEAELKAHVQAGLGESAFAALERGEFSQGRPKSKGKAK